jgi:large subunit ribosomal protein L15
MNLSQLTAPYGANKSKRVLGRGSSSGHGKTSTRGSKGQTSRSGRHFYLGFEGGTNPLIKRIPKRGFAAHGKIKYFTVNLSKLSRFKQGTVVDPQVLAEKGMAGKRNLIKILGDGELKHPLTIKAHSFSKSALEKIKSAGGQACQLKVTIQNNAAVANK